MGETDATERPVLRERRGDVTVLTLNRPAVLNALNGALWAAFDEELAWLADSDSRVVILTGAGERAFSAGADMREVSASTAEEMRARGEISRRATERLLDLRQPVIAAINGYAYGGGAILTTMCDIRIAAANAKFRFPGVAYGLVAATAYLPRIVGLPNAMDLALTARPVEADEALAMGLVNRVTPAGEALTTALELAELIAANEPEAVFATKQALRLSLAGDLASAREREAAMNRGYVGSDEHRRVFGDFVRQTLDRAKS
jgi:enoyl-CoA hydratase/carnithine racemase